MSKLMYCHMCGRIFEDKSEVYNITVKDLESKKSEKLFDVCGECGKKVLNIKFKPVKFLPSEIKAPKFTGVILRKTYPPKKEKLVYHVLPYQLEQIKALEVDIHDLQLRYKTGARLYTTFQVEKWMSLSTKNVIEAMMMVYAHQTEDEKKTRETKYSNSVGFNKPDATFMTGMSRIYECRGIDYTEKQLARIKKTMSKYSKQVTFYINTDRIILEGV